MDWDARLYDERHGFVGMYGNELVTLVHDIASARSAGSAAPRILDIGCGTGTHLDALAAIGPTTGIDASPAMVEQARRHHPHADIRLGDVCRLPFAKEFDIVFSNATFHWVPDQLRLLKNVASALAPRGAVIAEMGAKGNIAIIEKGFKQSLDMHGGTYANRFCFPEESDYRRLLGIAGFEIMAMRSFDRPTDLAHGREGLRRWAEQFFARSLAPYESEDRAALLDDLERICEPSLWDTTRACWVADYRRLRFVARTATV